MNTTSHTSILSRLILSTFMTMACVIHSFADTEPLGYNFDDYKGVWLTEIEGEAVYLLIKRNQIAHYFYKDRIDNSVYKGTWELDEGNFLLVSGLDFDHLSFRLESDSETLNEDVTDHLNITTSRLIKVPEEMLGEWARPPDYEEPKNKYMPSTYFGLWKTVDQATLRMIKVSDNRTAFNISEQSESTPSPDKLQGEWYKHGKQLHIVWEDGTYSIIDNSNESMVKLSDYASGESISEKTEEYTVITQSQSESDEKYWSENQSPMIERSNISLSQFDYKAMLKFYRGEWMILDQTRPDAIEIMKFSRFGGVDLASDKGTDGNWYPSGRGCLINLDDGIRMRLKHIGSAFLVFVYEATRPLDGYPNKILKAAPLNPEKLDLLSTKPYFTMRLLEQINQLNDQSSKSMPLISNWSDRDAINSPPSSPWWWPIWSDNTKNNNKGSFSTNNSSESLTKESDSIASNKETSLKNKTQSIDQIKTSKWKWPF